MIKTGAVVLATLFLLYSAVNCVAQDDDEGDEVVRQVVSLDAYVKDIRAQWDKLRQELRVVDAVLASRPIVDAGRKKAEVAYDAILLMLVHRYGVKPPPGLEAFDEAFIELLKISSYVSGLVVYCGEIQQPENLDYGVKKLRRLQSEVERLGRENKIFVEPSSQLLISTPTMEDELLKFTDGFPAERSADPAAVVVDAVKTSLSTAQREWAVQRQEARVTNYEHYYRLLCSLYRNIGTLREHLAPGDIPDELIDIGQAAILATFIAMRQAQQGQEPAIKVMDQKTIVFIARILLWMAGE